MDNPLIGVPVVVLIAGTLCWVIFSAMGLVMNRNPERDSEREEGHRCAVAFILTPVWPLVAIAFLGWTIVQIARSLRANL